MNSTPARTVSRWIMVGLASITIAIVGAWQLKVLFGQKRELPIDFVAFWTAGHLNSHGLNPYSPTNVRDLQHALGWEGTAIVTWNPPWLLTLVMPIGLIPIETASTLWQLFNLALLLFSIGLIWRGLDGPLHLWWVPQLIAVTLTPTIFLLGSGQVTLFVLLGLAGFVYFSKANRPFLAGILVSLTAIKPHLLILFAIWLLLGSLQSAFARRVVLGGLLAGVAVSIPPTLANSRVWGQYLDAIQSPSTADHHHYSDWKPPVIGWWLRQAVPGDRFFVQWCPAVFGSIVCLAWALKAQWNGSNEDAGQSDQPRLASFDLPDSAAHVTRSLPFIVGYSLLIAPYGVWPYDLVLLLVPILAVAITIARSPAVRTVVAGSILLGSVNAVSLMMMLLRISFEWYVWMVPTVLVGVARLNSRHQDWNSRSSIGRSPTTHTGGSLP